MKYFVMFTLLTLMLTGCTTTSTLKHTKALPDQVSSAGNPVQANLSASNTGLYFLYWIPIWSGKYTKPNRADYDCFENNVREKYMLYMLDDRCRKLKADHVEDVKIQTDDSGFFTLWLFWRRSIRATAVAIAPKEEKKQERKNELFGY